MMRTAQRWALAQWWRASDSARRNRAALYGGATGLRILTFHETAGAELAELRRIVEWCRRRFPIATPADADALFAGDWRAGPADRVLFTFDDGLASNFQAARWLASVGVQAIFFVVPSLVDRTFAEYLREHERAGVRAHVPLASTDAGGLSSAQVREMRAMGHRIGAHNFAHRDLGRLHEPGDLRYEISNALEGVAVLTGERCRDFAIGFGQPENLSDAAAAYLLALDARVYACHRGLNVPGRTPRFLLRHAVDPDHPTAFTRGCVEGGGDRRVADRAREVVRRIGVLPASRAPPHA